MSSCGFEYTYALDDMQVCSACQFTWNPNEVKKKMLKDILMLMALELFDGDDVIVIKDLRFKGSSDVIKQGTKAQNIKLVDKDRDIECRVPGFGFISLKTEIVKSIRVNLLTNKRTGWSFLFYDLMYLKLSSCNSRILYTPLLVISTPFINLERSTSRLSIALLHR